MEDNYEYQGHEIMTETPISSFNNSDSPLYFLGELSSVVLTCALECGKKLGWQLFIVLLK